MSVIIDPAAPAWTLLNTFEVLPARQASVVASLRAFTEAFARGRPGFVGAAVHASRDGARVVNYVQWRSEAGLRAMLDRCRRISIASGPFLRAAHARAQDFGMAELSVRY